MTSEVNNATETVNDLPIDSVDPSIPPVDQIEVFSWGASVQRQFRDGLPLFGLPKYADHYLRQEKDFVITDDRMDHWDESLAKKVGTGAVPCPYCAGILTVPRPYRGVVTGIRVIMQYDCLCRVYREYYKRWMDPESVSIDYRNIALHNIEHYSANFRTFEDSGRLSDLLKTVRKFQYNCYLLTGPAGTGKTTLMVAMFNRALLDWTVKCWERQTPYIPAVWKISATALSKQFRDWEMRDENTDDFGKPTPEPKVTVGKVMAAVNAHHVPCLFLDEIDKIKLNSEFQAKEFSALIDAIQSNGGQVVASSNLSELRLKSALGPQYGPPIIRRLIGPRLNPQRPEDPTDTTKGGFLIDFERGGIHHNHELAVAKVGSEPWDDTDTQATHEVQGRTGQTKGTYTQQSGAGDQGVTHNASSGAKGAQVRVGGKTNSIG